MPFVGALQEAPENYTIKKITLNCPNQELVKCHTEIGTDLKKMERQTVNSGVELNRPVSMGQILRVVVQVKQFVPEGIKGTVAIEVA